MRFSEAFILISIVRFKQKKNASFNLGIFFFAQAAFPPYMQKKYVCCSSTKTAQNTPKKSPRCFTSRMSYLIPVGLYIV